jgi:hypothetical protein
VQVFAKVKIQQTPTVNICTSSATSNCSTTATEVMGNSDVMMA